MSNVLINEDFSISVDIYKCSNVLDHSFSKVDISLGTCFYMLPRNFNLSIDKLQDIVIKC